MKFGIDRLLEDPGLRRDLRGRRVALLAHPASLSQDVGLALGAQAGEHRLTEVLNEGGFTHVRRAAETPFNIVLEARP